MRNKTCFLLILTVFFSALCGCVKNKENNKSPANILNLKPQTSFEGKIVFQSHADGDNEIYVLSKKGIKKLTQNSWDDQYPRWSPDGKKIVFYANPEGNYDIFMMNADGSNQEALTSSPADEKTPAWFPDGKKIVFARTFKKLLRDKTFLYILELSNRKIKRLIPDYSSTHAIPDVSPTASLITFTGKRTISWDVALYNLKQNKVKFLQEGGKSCRARFSPDGQNLVYVSSQADGKADIWLMNPDGSQKTRLTSNEKTYEYFPSWSPDGKYIVFNSSPHIEHSADWKLNLLEVKTGKITLLFDSPGNDIYPDWY